MNEDKYVGHQEQSQIKNNELEKGFNTVMAFAEIGRKIRQRFKCVTQDGIRAYCDLLRSLPY